MNWPGIFNMPELPLQLTNIDLQIASGFSFDVCFRSLCKPDMLTLKSGGGLQKFDKCLQCKHSSLTD
jgi:hypothetical protein